MGLVPIKKLVSWATSIQDTTRHWPTWISWTCTKRSSKTYKM